VATAAGPPYLRKQEGYGYACLKEWIHFEPRNKTRYCRFLDGDYSDYPDELTQLIAPILENNIDFVVGSRVARLREKTRWRHSKFWETGYNNFNENLFNATFTDLGPFRAIKYDKLLALNMEDKTYGWTVEMQLRF
jgi:hypothetical protein